MQASVASRVCASCGSWRDADSSCAACLIDVALQGDLQESGTHLDDFEILEEVARGGMGIVYRARQRMPARVVALKMILPAHVNSTGALARFHAEAEAAASLDHEGILPIYAVGEKDGAAFYSMKFAEGGSLEARLNQFQNKPKDCATLVAALARAIEHAHRHGILHRDLKPGNVLFDGAGQPFVSDFGLAKWLEREANLTQTLAILGTPYYMAPEQAAGGQTLTGAADIYSLGAILYHLLTGQPPFRGDNPMELLRQAAERLPQRPRALHREIPRDLETICLKCLEKNPASRYSSAAALADDLDRFLAGGLIRARRAGPAKHLLRWTKRNPIVTGLAAASACLLVSLAFVTHHRDADASAAQPSVAVLPFENSDADNASASFPNGIHDDVLVDLSKIAALKVISHDSVMQYRGTARDLREIGNALGVNAVLEGNVRRDGERVRVNVQLTKTADGSQIWAENFERAIGDAFTVETEIALRIADVLKAKVSAVESARLRSAPTKNSEAYRRFVEAKNLYADYRKPKADLEKAERLYGEAIALDPSFALAYAHLSQLENVYFTMYDHTPARREKSRAAAREALRLQPDLPEAHVALGQDYWRANADTGDINYEKALAEFALAQSGLPNDADVYESIGRIQRLQGKWRESTENLRRAVSLDPNSIERWHRLFFNYELTRNYRAAGAALEHAIVLAPAEDRLTYLAHRAQLTLFWKGDTSQMERLLHQQSETAKLRTQAAIDFNIYLHHFEEAEKIALADVSQTSSRNGSSDPPDPLVLGQIYSYMHDGARARAACENARALLEQSLRQNPTNPAQRMMFLAEAYARLGRKDDAAREGKSAAAIIPESKDAYHGLAMQRELAAIYMLVGDFEQAARILDHALSVPDYFCVNDFRADPLWEPLRDQPAGQRLLTKQEVVFPVDTTLPLPGHP
jgi:serine/threonine protein kinase/Flp pilus assembly protein TadD